MMSNPSIKYGIYAGVILVVIDLVLYLISPKAMIVASSYIALPIIIISMVLASRDYKNENEGYASFKEIFTASWLTYLFTGLITSFFTYFLYNFIAPDLLDLARDISAQAMESMKGLLGEEAYEKAMEQLENENPMSLSSTLLSLPVKYIFAAVIALIIGAAMKRERDPFA